MSTRKTIRIALLGVAEDYQNSLIPIIISSLGYKIEWIRTVNADLVIFGPFFNANNAFRWAPRPLRPVLQSWVRRLRSTERPLTLFQTAENVRHNHIPCDYALSFDLAVSDSSHYRYPYWMEMLDWSGEGVIGNTNPRFGCLLTPERLIQPLGTAFLQKARKAAIFASHQREPRATLIRKLREHIEVDGFGPVFDASVLHHSDSTFTKREVLKGYAYNLCPENSLYPGYYTEKIVEAFYADSLPLAWVDECVSIDFNPNAMINLAPMMKDNFRDLAQILGNEALLQQKSDEPLLFQRPSIEPLKAFLKNVITDALT
ncbi:MAG: glycosyltransferase family 10 [Rhodoferax sp.]|nr:glycosyltransferase family 10 [Rhodoferax sp.]